VKQAQQIEKKESEHGQRGRNRVVCVRSDTEAQEGHVAKRGVNENEVYLALRASTAMKKYKARADQLTVVKKNRGRGGEGKEETTGHKKGEKEKNLRRKNKGSAIITNMSSTINQ